MLLRHAMVLAVTAMPGVQRLLAILLVARFHGLETVGRIASDLGVVAILGFFSAVGWSALLMIRLPRARPARQAQFLFGIFVRAGAVILFFVPLLWGMALLGVVFSWIGASIYLASWSVFQLVRHYWLARQAYGVLLAAELGCLAATVTMLLVGGSDSLAVFLALSVPAAVLALGVLVTLLRQVMVFGLAPVRPVRHVWRTPMGFGLSNAMTGGIGAALTPLIRASAGDVYAGVAAIVLSVVSVLLLLPRALSFQQLVPLTQAVGRRDWNAVRMAIRLFRRRVVVVLIITSIIASLVWVGGLYRLYGLDASVPALHHGFFLGLASFLLSQIVLPEGNLLGVLESVHAQLAINAVTAVFFLVSCGLVVLLIGDSRNIFLGLMTAQLTATSVRCFGTAWASHRALAGLR